MSKGRSVGVAVAIAAFVGLVGVSSLPKKPVSQMSRLFVVHKALMKAFSIRSLTELDKQTKSHLSFRVMQEDSSIGDEGLAIIATFQTDSEGGVDKPTIYIEFEAKEGKGGDLEQALNNVGDAVQAAANSTMEEEKERRLE